MAEAVIQTHQLTKVFHHPFFTWKLQARAVTDLNMRVDRGGIFGLLGPNGSGKSTTIKILLGLLFPTSGQAAIFGKRPTDVAVKARLGFLPEESYLYRFLDAEETLDFFGRLFNLPAAERRRRTDMLLDLTGLSRERHRPIAEFSKGMARRVGLATCLINDPELVILDEPTTGLDPLGTREVKDLILELRRKGKTVLLSSHLLADVEDVCDRVTILYGGRVQAEGPIRDLLRRGKNAQITAEMDDATARAAAELIRSRMGTGADVEVRPATERLEQYFLRIVREAQSKRLATSGAAAAAGSLDFLSQLDRADADAAAAGLLGRLAAAEPTAAASAAGSPESAADAPGANVRLAGDGEAVEAARGLLDRLASGRAAEAAAAEARRSAETVAAAGSQPDLALLDSLAGQDTATPSAPAAPSMPSAGAGKAEKESKS